jgi:GNAT superfamily N-acetyltransferase
MSAVEFNVLEFDYSSATDSDVQQIRAVYEHAFEHDIGIQFDATLDSDFTQPLSYYSESVRGAYFVVRHNLTSELVGTAGIRAVSLPDSCTDFSCSEGNGRTCELKRMFILPVGRGRGLGGALLQLVLAKARSLGYAVVVLDTKRKLVAANACYEKAGFLDCSNYNGNPRADRFMALRLY